MATYTNVSYGVKNVSTSSSSLTTVSSGTLAVSSLVISNTTTSPITASAFITRSGTDFFLIRNATIPVGGSLEVIQGNRVILQASDALKVSASAANSADCWASGLTVV